MLVYSVTDRGSFDQIEGIKRSIDRAKEGEDEWPIAVAGNKADLEDRRVVSSEEGGQLAQKLGGSFFETSAKTRANLEETFFSVVRAIRKLDEKKNPKGKGGKEALKKRKNCAIL